MLYIICGPTASGKTKAAIELAEHFNAPIINADAFQIYKDMNIGTAKIEKDNPYYNRHYLLDIISPNENFSVKEYQTLFRQTVEKLSNVYPHIIVVGGTGLYIKAAIYDYVFEEMNDDITDLEKLSNDELYNMLIKLDKKASEAIHINNRKRVIRAISIARSGKVNKSENIASQEHKILYDAKILMISPERETLYKNINKRVDIMFNDGLLDEVTMLLKKYTLSSTAKAAIGYKEVIDYINGDISLLACQELIKKRSRNYAKRQVTFFKNQFDLLTFEDSNLLIDWVKNNE